MVPTFHNGDYLLIDELTYRFGEPNRGEVIVFRYPKDEATYFIKRVIGLPGERVVIESGVVTIYNAEHRDGLVLKEAYLPESMKTEGDRDIRLGKDEYYMLGDNRPYSFDSRRWGALPRQDIVGRVIVRLWPATQAAVITTPDF
jgi:signal peptidase I